MKNWSGYVQFKPEIIAYPDSETAVQQIVQNAVEQGKKIRIIGSGHSFSPICKTDGILLSLDKYQGLIGVNEEKCQATVKAGTKLDVLGNLLFKHGMAMKNMGDIDKQSIAGTISTSTHGTGKDFGTISTQVIALRFVNGKGVVVQCSENQNKTLFKAAQVSLGTMGIITEITLQCVPAYKLEMKNGNEKLNEVLATLDERNENNRNFEFYWLPYTNGAWTKTANIVTDQPDKVTLLNHFSDYIIENYGFKLLSEIAHKFPSKNEWVSKVTSASISNVKKVDHSHKVYATVRLVRFHEMEYNVPVEAHKEVLKEVIKQVNSKKFNIHFPIENRIVKGDDMYISPAYGRNSAYIAFHTYYKKDPFALF